MQTATKPYASGKIKKKSAAVVVDLIIDTREQLHWHFDSELPSDFIINTTQVDGLPAGDYSIVGYDIPGPEGIIIERKRSLTELTTNFGTGWDRFMRECEIMSGYGSAHIVVEDDLHNAVERYLDRDTHVNFPPAFYMKRAVQIQARYGIQLHWASSRSQAQTLACYLFQQHVIEDRKLDD